MTKVQPFTIADEEEVKKIEDQQKRIDKILEFIKEEGLDKDQEFMQEINEVLDLYRK